MTRTITTAAELDALPVGSVILDNMGDAGLIDERDGERLVQYAETSRVSLRHAAKHYLPATVLHDPSAPAPAPSVVPEAAVPNDAAVDAVAMRLYLADRDPKARGAWSALGDGQKSPYRAFAYDLITAALPHLAAQPAPEASREDVVSLLVGLDALSPDPAELVADVLLARFVVTDPHEDGCPHTPKASREDLTGIINDAAFEDAARSEHHVEGLLARFVITERGDR